MGSGRCCEPLHRRGKPIRGAGTPGRGAKPLRLHTGCIDRPTPTPLQPDVTAGKDSPVCQANVTSRARRSTVREANRPHRAETSLEKALAGDVGRARLFFRESGPIVARRENAGRRRLLLREDPARRSSRGSATFWFRPRLREGHCPVLQWDRFQGRNRVEGWPAGRVIVRESERVAPRERRLQRHGVELGKVRHVLGRKLRLLDGALQSLDFAVQLVPQRATAAGPAANQSAIAAGPALHDSRGVEQTARPRAAPRSQQDRDQRAERGPPDCLAKSHRDFQTRRGASALRGWGPLVRSAESARKLSATGKSCHSRPLFRRSARR